MLNEYAFVFQGLSEYLHVCDWRCSFKALRTDFFYSNKVTNYIVKKMQAAPLGLVEFYNEFQLIVQLYGPKPYRFDSLSLPTWFFFNRAGSCFRQEALRQTADRRSEPLAGKHSGAFS